MSLSAGARLGPYEILALIGAGGMGEVYRARDTRLGRDVAIKVSQEQFSDRFEREARAVAALNHPNICALYDVGPNYLVMELVEGDSPKGPLPLDEALRIAAQIAEALKEAHEKGVVHRDLKPANIKITPQGTVKVLDLGLAKMVSPAEAGATAAMTLDEMTRPGVILGTAAYMAPEQAQGKPVDKRADIWAFGVVLHELLTGQKLFKGETLADTLVAVLTREPDWERVPAKVRPMLRRCLVKDPRHRLRDIGDAMPLLEELPASAPRWRSWLAWSTAAVLLATLAPVAVMHFREKPLAAEPVRFQITPAGIQTGSEPFALSPDGRQLAFAAVASDGVSRLWVQGMDSLVARPLPGTESSQAFYRPFSWSPDSRFIAFDAGRTLKKIDPSGGPAQTVCDLPGEIAVGSSWNRDDVIIFGTQGGGLMKCSAAGGAASPLTTRSREQGFHIFPLFLPDGRHFLYLETSNTRGHVAVYIGSLDARPEEQPSRLKLETSTGATYVPTADSDLGHLLFLREGTLMAQPFDSRRLELAGDPVPVAEGVGAFLSYGYFSASTTGVLVHRVSSQDFHLTWFDRQGKALSRAGEPGRFLWLALSPDGTRVAVARVERATSTSRDLWLLDLARDTPTRFTFGPYLTDDPVWSPDGSRLAFSSTSPGPWNTYWKPRNDPGKEELLLKTTEDNWPTSWSRDGRFLLYEVTDQKTRNDVWVLSLGDDRKQTRLLGTEFIETEARFSPAPEGPARWIAFSSDESGRSEVYLRAFPDSRGNEVVSRGGGSSPRWRRDGRELYYLAPDGKVMAVEIPASPGLQVGAPKHIFQTPPGFTAWDTTDGQRFLFAAPGEQGTQAPFTVLQNWQATLKK